MAKELPDTDFDKLAQTITDNATSLPITVEVDTDNPYIVLKSTSRLPNTREEVLSSLGEGLLDAVETDYTLSFTNADKNNGKYEYTIRVKELTTSVF